MKDEGWEWERIEEKRKEGDRGVSCVLRGSSGRAAKAASSSRCACGFACALLWRLVNGKARHKKRKEKTEKGHSHRPRRTATRTAHITTTRAEMPHIPPINKCQLGIACWLLGVDTC